MGNSYGNDATMIAKGPRPLGRTAMLKQIRKLAADQSGATAVEYGALVMFVGLAIVLALEGIGLSLEGTFTALKSVFASAGTGNGG